MVNFKERTNPQTNVKYNPNAIPSVTISDLALQKMFVYTSEVTDEVGWLGTVEDLGNNSYLISDTFLIDQEVHGTTTEISPEGLASLGEQLLAMPDGFEIWNKMQMWGHSHVNMGISPSGQDDKQMKEFEGNGYPFFIRLICNKRGEMKLDFYNYESGLEFHDIPWVREVKEDAYQKRIDELLAQVEILQEEKELREKEAEKAMVETITTPIKAEIKEKVKKLVTHWKGVRGTAGTTTYPSYGGQTYLGNGSTYHQQTFVIDSDYAQTDAIGLKYSVYTFFSQKEIIQMAQEFIMKQDLIEDLFDSGQLSQFSKKDIEVIWQEITKQQWNMGAI